MSSSTQNSFVRKVIAARYWLIARGADDSRYLLVLKMMEFAAQHHNGKRNGGGPEFMHQVEIFHHMRTLASCFTKYDAPIIFALAFLHDIIEDGQKQPDGSKKFVSIDMIRSMLNSDPDFAEAVCSRLYLLSKEIMDQKNPDYSLDTIFMDRICAAVKLADRCNNISTMMGVFKKPRAERYIVETRGEFLPNAKEARRTFPEYEAVFENMKLFLNAQLNLIDQMMPTYTHGEAPPAPEEKPVMRVPIQAIMAVGPEGVIGYESGALFVKAKEDMQHFKEYTTGKAVVMGRATFESIARNADGSYRKDPLPGRHIYVISARTEFPISANWTRIDPVGRPLADVITGLSYEVASVTPAKALVVCGGAQIFNEVLATDIFDEVVVTEFTSTPRMRSHYDYMSALNSTHKMVKLADNVRPKSLLTQLTVAAANADNPKRWDVNTSPDLKVDLTTPASVQFKSTMSITMFTR